MALTRKVKPTNYGLLNGEDYGEPERDISGNLTFRKDSNYDPNLGLLGTIEKLLSGSGGSPSGAGGAPSAARDFVDPDTGQRFNPQNYASRATDAIPVQSAPLIEDDSVTTGLLDEAEPREQLPSLRERLSSVNVPRRPQLQTAQSQTQGGGGANQILDAIARFFDPSAMARRRNPRTPVGR